MAEILGLGLTHAPSLIRPDEDGESSLKRTLRENKNVPPEMKIPANSVNRQNQYLQYRH